MNMVMGAGRRVVGGLTLLGLFGAGVALGLAHPLLPEHAPRPEVRALVAEAAEAAAGGDLRPVWDRLAPSTRRQFTRSHEALLKFAVNYGERRETDRAAGLSASALERQYGMPLADLARTTPADLWVRQSASLLGPGAQHRAFAGIHIDSIETDGVRAAVRSTLGDGRPQGVYMVREEGGWWLVDFRPYAPLEKAGIPVRPAPAALPDPGARAVAVPPRTPAPDPSR